MIELNVFVSIDPKTGQKRYFRNYRQSINGGARFIGRQLVYIFPKNVNGFDVFDTSLNKIRFKQLSYKLRVLIRSKLKKEKKRKEAEASNDQTN